MYQDARGRGTTDDFVRNLYSWRGEGKEIITRLWDAISKTWPCVDWEVKDLRLQMFELTVSLQEGISAIESTIALHRVSRSILS